MIISKRHTIIGALGWYGAAALLVAFFLVSNRIVDAGNGWYLFLSVTGALGLAVDSQYHKATPAALLNCVYALVGIVAFLRFF